MDFTFHSEILIFSHSVSVLGPVVPLSIDFHSLGAWAGQDVLFLNHSKKGLVRTFPQCMWNPGKIAEAL